MDRTGGRGAVRLARRGGAGTRAGGAVGGDAPVRTDSRSGGVGRRSRPAAARRRRRLVAQSVLRVGRGAARPAPRGPVRPGGPRRLAPVHRRRRGRAVVAPGGGGDARARAVALSTSGARGGAPAGRGRAHRRAGRAPRPDHVGPERSGLDGTDRSASPRSPGPSPRGLRRCPRPGERVGSDHRRGSARPCHARRLSRVRFLRRRPDQAGSGGDGRRRSYGHLSSGRAENRCPVNPQRLRRSYHQYGRPRSLPPRHQP